MTFWLVTLGIIYLFVAEIALLRWFFHGDWKTHHVHKCGFHTEHISQVRPCASCGESDNEWVNKIMRATPWFTWETKK